MAGTTCTCHTPEKVSSRGSLGPVSLIAHRFAEGKTFDLLHVQFCRRQNIMYRFAEGKTMPKAKHALA
jgi:hypothetical protein